MLDLEFLEEIIPNIDEWTYAELKKIKLMNLNEILDSLKMCAETNKDEEDRDIDTELFTNLCVTAIYYMIKKKEK